MPLRLPRFAALNTVPKIGIGTAAALSFVLFIVLIIPTGPTPLYCTSILLLLLLLLLLPRLWRLSKRACVSMKPLFLITLAFAQ